MTDNTQYAMMMQSLTELAPEILEARSRSQPLRHLLHSSLKEVLPLPPQAVFLGIAADGFPVLLNLTDPVPGPLLIAGDPGSGKTSLLQVIARAAEVCNDASDVQIGVITGKPEEWAGLPASAHLLGVFPTYSGSAQDLIRSLEEWAHANRKDHRSFLLLLDELRSVMDLAPETLQKLRWLFSRGPSRKVWPIVTLDPGTSPEVRSWTSFFHTRLFGWMHESQDHGLFREEINLRLDGLEAGSEFLMREGSGWLKFWIPVLD